MWSSNKSHINGFNNDNWSEIRFDIVGTLTDMRLVGTGSVDAIYSSHNIEHIYPHEVEVALREFYRVLKDDGMVVLRCPDLQSVCEAVIQDKLLEPLYESASGPITPMDILYGHIDSVAKGNDYMAHKCGFTYSVLDRAFHDAGFKTNFGGGNSKLYELFIVSMKQEKSDEEIRNIGTPFLPI